MYQNNPSGMNQVARTAASMNPGKKYGILDTGFSNRSHRILVPHLHRTCHTGLKTLVTIAHNGITTTSKATLGEFNG